ncbi:MAG: hypothetical protein C4321_02870, partial [Chloroflexota bacterium]
MVDTVTFYFPHPFRQPHDGWVPRYVHWNREARVQEYHLNSSDARLTLKYLGPTPTMLVECSLPRLIWGHNIHLLGLAEFIQAAGKLHDLITEATPEEVPPLEFWALSRVDFCHAWRVADPFAYINSMSKASDCTKRQKRVHWHTPAMGGDTLERR